MHILYLVPHVPNPTKVRSHYQIRGLVEAGHTVTVITLIRKPTDVGHVAALRSDRVNVIAPTSNLAREGMSALMGYALGLPLQARMMWSPRLAEAIDRELDARWADVAHVEHLRMAHYGLRLSRRLPVVWDAVDHLGAFFESAERSSLSLAWRAAGRVEAPRLWNYERWLTAQFPLTLVIGKRDQVMFERDNPCADRVVIAPPGLPVEPLSEQPRHSENLLVISGTMDYHPNVASVMFFIQEVLPLIWAVRPDLRLQIVGARPVAAIRKLQGPRIDVVGFVPSVGDYLARATIAIAPVVYAAGVQHKVIEAFLTQTPVVATTAALGGLDVNHEREVVIADEPESFAAAVLKLLDDRALRLRIGRAGRRYVEKNHDLQRTTRHLTTLYELAQRRFAAERAS